MPTEQPDAGYPLDDEQQQRILSAVLTGPVAELVQEVVRRLPQPGRKSLDGVDDVLAAQRQMKPMNLEIPPVDESPRTQLPWPGSALTWDDRRRLATIGNTTKMPTTRVLHHAVRVAHHIFQTVMLEIIGTSERTGTPLRDLLTAVSRGTLERGCAGARQRHEGTRLPGTLDTATATTASGEPAIIARSGGSATKDDRILAAEAANDASRSLPIPPHSMAKRTSPPASREGVSEDRIEELEARIDRLQETMDVLIDAIDGLRVDLVHALRNLPDQLPPPLQVHSLALDPTAPDFGQRVNAIPPEVMARLREEATRARGGESVFAAAAEGDPVPAPVVDEPPGNDHRRGARQGRLFG